MIKTGLTASTAIKIIFEDPHLILLSKPPGLLSQGAHPGEENVVDWLRQYLGRPYVGLIHRLDRNTSGLLLVAKRTKSAQRLTQALQGGNINRTYLAWLSGNLSHEVRWSHQLQKNPSTNQVRVVARGGKEASLIATPVEHRKTQGHDITLARFQLETGRSHQIRVQAAFEGFPLLGDHKYGGNSPTLKLAPRVALHSYEIEFPHPIGGAILKFTDPLPDDLKLK